MIYIIPTAATKTLGGLIVADGLVLVGGGLAELDEKNKIESQQLGESFLLKLFPPWKKDIWK